MKKATNCLLCIAGLVVVISATLANLFYRITDYESPFFLLFDGVMIAILFFAMMQLLKWAAWVL